MTSKQDARTKTLKIAKIRGRVIPTLANLNGTVSPEDMTYYSKSMPSKVLHAKWYQQIGVYDFECELLLIRDGNVIARIELNDEGCWNKYTASVRGGGFNKFSRQSAAIAWVYRELENQMENRQIPSQVA
jgi:hypothetical protein